MLHVTTFTGDQIDVFDDHDCWRSEEHTSELQSQSNLVCRLLLEKKKNTRPSASPIATLVCDPPESTPSKTTEGRTDVRAPGSDGIDVPSFRRSVGACDHRTSNPNRDRYASSQRHIPRPRQAGKPAQWEMRKDGSQDDRGHDQDAHDQGDDDIALPRSR